MGRAPYKDPTELMPAHDPEGALLDDQQPGTVGQAAPPARPRTHYLANILLAAVLLLTSALRFHLRNIPLERDEGEYAYAGQLMLEGIPPYKLAYNMKLPGTYAAYALIMAVLGQTTGGVRLGVLVINLATIFFVFLLARRFAGSTAAVAAGASYALLSASPSVLGFCGHATHFVVLAALAGMLLLLKAIERDRKWMFFCAGVLFGFAYLMKQPGAVFALFGAFYLLRTRWRSGPNWRAPIQMLVLYLLGAALPFLVTCLLLWRAGVFNAFWFWTVSYATQYASDYGLIAGAYFFTRVVQQIVGSSPWIWLIAAVGVLAVFKDRQLRAQAPFILGFLAFSFFAVCPTLAFRPHYFILLLPAVSIVAGIAVSVAQARIEQLSQVRIHCYAPAVLFTLALFASFYCQRSFFLETDPIAACYAVYPGHPFPEAVSIATYIREHTSTDDTIAVLGSEPEIYFYARRHSATGYIYTYGLMEDQKYALQMQQQMIGEIEAARPEFLVFVNLQTSWTPGPNSQQLIYTWARNYIQQKYDLVGVVDNPKTSNNFRWGSEAKTYQARPYSSTFIFRKKTT